MKVVSDVGSLRVNGYVLIDDEPSQIVGIEKSKPGKHGSAKARVEAIGIFDGKKRTLTNPVSAKCDVPLVDKSRAQVISIGSSEAQVMDITTFETFDLQIDKEYKEKLTAGEEIVYLSAMGKRKIFRA